MESKYWTNRHNYVVTMSAINVVYEGGHLSDEEYNQIEEAIANRYNINKNSLIRDTMKIKKQ